MTSRSLYCYDAAYRPNLEALVKAPGVVAVNGYLTGVYASTTTQPAEAHAHGMGWVATYEEGRDELVGATRATGRAVGRKILAGLAAKGAPLDGTVAVYPSVDVNVSAGAAASCDEGWRGMRDVLACKVSLRAYAEGAVIDALVKAGLVDGKCWLAAPTSWPGFRVDDPNVCMVQLVGTNVPGTDQNHLVTDPSALGAWWPDGSPYGGTEDMASWDDPIPVNMPDGKTETHPAHFLLARAYADALGALQTSRESAASAKSASDALNAPNGVVKRVAELQATIDKVAATLESLLAVHSAPSTSPVEVTLAVDAQNAVATATAAKIAALTFKAGQ